MYFTSDFCIFRKTNFALKMQITEVDASNFCKHEENRHNFLVANF